MAHNQHNTFVNSGLKRRRSILPTNNNERENEMQMQMQMQIGMAPYPNPQMMGWIPQYPQQQMGGWMQQHPQMMAMAPNYNPNPNPNPNHNPNQHPHPHPQMMAMAPNYNYQFANPQFANPQMMGWMPMQQQPFILPQQTFNNRGFAPSHNGDVQDNVQINELDTESDDYELIDHVASAVGAKSDHEDEIPIQQNTIKKQSRTSNKNEQKLKKTVEHENQDAALANLFDNVLDDNMQVVNPNQYNYAEFGQELDNSNVIARIIPVDKEHAHFDNAQYPNETYKTVMLNDVEKILPAKNISVDALETGKIVYEHNKKLATSGQAISGEAFIYTRCSRTNDISIETQRKACIQYAATHNLKLLSFGYQSDNNISARNMGNLNHELGFWKDHIPNNSHIIIYSVDRLSRHLVKGMQFLEEMTSRGIRVHFITHELVYHSGISAAGHSMVQQELQSAEKFSNIASEKIRSTNARLRQEGHVLGRAPYGYKHTLINGVRKLIPNNEEQANINKIKTRYTYLMNNWKNNPETATLRLSKICMLRILLRWCNRTGLKYRKQQNYTILQLNKIIQTNFNNL
jgi:DNA invertase Pin-like site-specific DNA recombinase